MSLQTFRGKVVVANFWATWCVPCKLEIPDLNRLHAQYASRGVVILGFNVDEPAETVRRYLVDTPIRYPVLLTAGHKSALEAFGVDEGLPTTVFIKRDGSICRRRIGLTRGEVFEGVIQALL